MKQKHKHFINIFLKKILIILLTFSFLSSSFLPYFNLGSPFQIETANAQGNSCSAASNNQSNSQLSPRVGGVALDQAASFLSDMTEYTGAYYDESLDRIVFIGKTNTQAPNFDKDDLAISIRAIFFNNTIPAVSLEKKITDTNGDEAMDVKMYGGIEDTKFGQVLLDADYKLKQYIHGYDANNNPINSSVPTYKSVLNRYIALGPDKTKGNSSRWWIVPELITLKKDDPSQSFVFDSVVMKVRTEPLSMNNAPTWNQAAQDFANDQTVNYDAYAQETPDYFRVKQLAKIVGVVKWIHDRGIATDMNWAKDYTPKYQQTPREMPRLTTPWVNGGDGASYNMSGGIQYDTGNSYNPDDGSAASLKASSQSVDTTKEDIHWTFTNNGQDYEAVAVAADVFRSLGSYNTTAIDMAFPTAGDLNLAFSRSYSSYSGGQYGIGRGWNMFPGQLTDNKPDNPTWRAYCAGETLSHRYKLAFQGPGGLHETFTWTCPDGFKPDDSVYHSKVFDNNDRTLITVRLKNQTEYIFKDEFSGFKFKLLQIKDKNGNKISYNYDSEGKLASITDNQNHAITINYNNKNLISSVADWTGRTVSYSYDEQGNLLTVTDPNGGVTTYTYNADFKLTSVKDREGNVTVVNTYNPEAKLATQKNAANITNTFTYNDTAREVIVEDNLGRSEKTKYDEKARILEQTDPAQKSVKYTYGQEFSPLTITDKNNNKVTYTYDANGNLTSATYPDNKQVTYEYDSKNRVTKILDYRYGTTPKETKYMYDTSGNLIQLDEASILTNFTYDPTGEILTLTDPLNKKTTWTRDSFGNKLTEKNASDKTTTYEYDSLARLKKITDPNSKVLSFTYDNNGNLLTTTDGAGTITNVYDKDNRLKRTTLPTNAVSEYAYNSTGSLNSVTDPLNNLTSYGYDSYQNLTSQTDALDRTTNHVYDNLNRLTQSTTPLGKVAKWEYDANGNISKRTDENNKITTYLYDAFNRLTKITYPDLKTVTYTYDSRGNVLNMVDPVGTTTYVYDSFDRLTKATNPYGRVISYAYDNADNLTSITYPDNRVVTYTYDENNRIASVKDWNNSATSYTYHDNGQLATKTAPNGIVSSYSYDSANRVSVIEHKKSLDTVAKFTYERDSLGNITKATEEGSFLNAPTPTPTPTTSGQDLVITGLSTTPVSPAPGSNYTLSVKVKNQGTAPTGNVIIRIPYYYDLASSPTYATPVNYSYSTNVNLAAGQEITLNINAASISTSGNHTIWAMVDQSKVVPETNEDNNSFGPHAVVVGGVNATPTPTPTPTPTSATTPTPTSTPMPTPTPGGVPQPDITVTNITTTPENPAPNTSFTTSVTVKNQGTATVPSTSFRLVFYYGLSQQPTSSTGYTSSTNIFTNSFIPGESRVYTNSHSGFTASDVKSIYAWVDQQNTIQELNEDNNILGHSVTLSSTGGFSRFFATIGIRHLAALFSVPTVSAQTPPLTYVTNFTYDPLSRIKTAEYPNDIRYAFTYDKVDNRLTMNVASASGGLTIPYVYNNDNQLTNMGTASFAYDNNGNQTNKTNSQGSSSYLYNFENRLTKYTPPSGSAANYTYDGNNNRLAKSVGFTTTRFVTDILGELPRTLAETNSSNSITKSYVYGLGLISQGQTGATSRDYYLEDGLGNIRFVTDEVGNKVRSTEYDPFGNWHKAQGQANIHMLFQGQQQDPESSLYYMRARYYDPFIGRFISKDPVKGYLTIPQTQNPYIYSLNNPINLSDPSGLDAIGVCNCVSGGVGVWGAASSCNVTTPNGSGKVNSTTQGGSAYDIVSVGKSLYYNWDDNVKNVSDLYGTSNVLGFNVGPVDVTFEKNTETNKVTAVEVQIGKGISTPIGIHGGVNQSSPPVSSGAW